ncbi:MAG TPA: hypothetical protein VF790_02150 [Dissulfurispiraceae bacterium]
MGNVLKHLNVLNVALLITLILSVNYVMPSLMHTDAKYTPLAVKKAAQPGDEAGKEEPVPSALDFVVIGEKNLFHPDRKIPPEKAAEQKPLPKPEFVLYGTLMREHGSVAYLEDKKDPFSTPGRGKRVTVLKQGESLSGFVLKSIEPDKVVMARGAEIITVPLDTPKQRSAEATAAIGGPAFYGTSRRVVPPPPPPSPARAR